MEYIEALEKRNRILEKLERDIQELEEIKEKIREEIRKEIFNNGIEKEKVDSPPVENKYKAVGIDSARGIRRYIPSNFYAYVCVSFREELKDYIKEADFDLISFVEEEVEYADRILEGLSMSAEILLAKRELENVDLIFMDGSVSTFIIKINSAITAAINSNGSLSKKLKQFYESIIDAFIEILSSGKVVFVPKSTQKDDLKKFILNNISSLLKDKSKDRIKSISDIKLAQIILKPLEYIRVSIEPHPYNLHNPYRAMIKKYEDENKTVPREIIESEHNFSRKINRLFELANNPEVFYFKGIGGYAFRLESFVDELPMDLIAQYTFAKTFYLTAEADRRAKDYVKTLLEEGFPLEEEIR